MIERYSCLIFFHLSIRFNLWSTDWWSSTRSSSSSSEDCFKGESWIWLEVKGESFLCWDNFDFESSSWIFSTNSLIVLSSISRLELNLPIASSLRFVSARHMFKMVGPPLSFTISVTDRAISWSSEESLIRFHSRFVLLLWKRNEIEADQADIWLDKKPKLNKHLF